jgi:hypothetical protein
MMALAVMFSPALRKRSPSRTKPHRDDDLIQLSAWLAVALAWPGRIGNIKAYIISIAGWVFVCIYATIQGAVGFSSPGSSSA